MLGVPAMGSFFGVAVREYAHGIGHLLIDLNGVCGVMASRVDNRPPPDKDPMEDFRK